VKASNFNTVLYADDINLHISGKNHEILEKTVNHELKKIDHWVRANKLCSNYSKSDFMLMNNHEISIFQCQLIITHYQNKAA